MAALNLPSAGDVERLERRLRSFSQRLEDVEDADRRPQPRARRPAARNAEEAPKKRSLTLNLRSRVRRGGPAGPSSRSSSSSSASSPDRALGGDSTAAAATPSSAARGEHAPSACRRPGQGGRKVASGRWAVQADDGPGRELPNASRSSRSAPVRRATERGRRRWQAARSRGRSASVADDQLAELEVAPARRRFRPAPPAAPQLGEVGEDDGGARPAHPRRLNRQLVARRRSSPRSPRDRARGCSSSAPGAAPGRAPALGRGRRRDRLRGDRRGRSQSGRHQRSRT